MNISKKQKKQESEYRFPYHYLDFVEGFRLIEYLDYVRFVKKLIGDAKGKKILDAGCGDGRFCFELRNKGAEVIGIDYSERAINFARAFNPKAKFFVDDLTKFRLYKKIDVIVSIETLEHIEPEKIRSVFENFHKMLGDEGKLIITVPSKNVKTGSKHFQHFSREDLSKLMDELFNIERVFGHGKKGYFRKKMFNFRLGLGYISEARGYKKYKKALKRYYRKYLGVCNTNKGKRLIVVAKKI